MSTLLEISDEPYYDSVLKFIWNVDNRKTEGSYNVTVATVSLLKDIIAKVDFKNAAELLEVIRAVGRHLCQGLPHEPVPGNMVRRILRIIREEYAAGKATEDSGTSAPDGGDSLQGLVRATRVTRYSMHSETPPELRETVLEHITEFQTELETSGDSIESQAVEHIHANELILTLGASKLVEKFLKRAAKERMFHVIVAEGADYKQSHHMALRLGKGRIETTVIPDSNTMAVMSRVNKVIIGTRGVLAGGGLLSPAGAHTLALAAKHYGVPVIVLAPLYKLSPTHCCSYEEDIFNTLISPEETLSYGTGAVIHLSHVYRPLYEYVPPDLVTLFITNQGGNAPSYIYRLISELYHPDDYEL